MEWQVGQWVTRKNVNWKIKDIRPGDGVLVLEGYGSSYADDCKPFEWQVGKTYKTTRDGTTAIVRGTSVTGNVIGVLSNGVALSWDNKTGLVIGYEQHDGAQHLLPFLADEPSEQKNYTSNPVPPDPFPTYAGDIGDLSFYRGGAMHFLVHCGKFGNDELTDLRNAKTYVEMEINRLEKQRKGGA